MKRVLLPLFCILPACALFQKPPRPVHAPREEAADVEIPLAFPTEGRQVINGTTLRAIQLAMEDYLPWDRSNRPGLGVLTAASVGPVLSARHEPPRVALRG